MSPTRVERSAIKRARSLRRDMTEGESRLWSELKQFRGSYDIHVRRQAPIGPYIVDFVVQSHRLVIELDGEHHFTEAGMARDARRDAKLADLGYRVHRINTGELDENLDGCIEILLRELGVT
ncbi:endonuclease domain-containing protein [Oceaniradius stylonematis]|uniref:endonuclease domain-containing protein n=1 Tax=Oceaniradius stylonematis TaxID=2184161 RepID=UPI003C7ACFA6